MQAYKITSTGVVISNRATVRGFSLTAAGAAATLVLNDSTDGSGDDKASLKITAVNTSDSQNVYGTEFATGVYATLTGASAIGYIYID